MNEHYQKASYQPIEYLQRLLSPQEFQAFCLGNEIKYKMRSDFKGQKQEDLYKAKVYNYWRFLSIKGVMINPTEHLPADDYVYKFALM